MATETKADLALDRLLNNIIRLAEHTKGQLENNFQVLDTHPSRLQKAETKLALVMSEIIAIRNENQIAAANWEEISDAFPVIVDMLYNHVQASKNLAFLQTSDIVHLRRFLKAVLLHGQPVIIEAINDLSSGDKQRIRYILERVNWEE